ncbi:MAG: hypothetical protein WB525_10750, partial [Pseudolabrys sp.]
LKLAVGRRSAKTTSPSHAFTIASDSHRDVLIGVADDQEYASMSALGQKQTFAVQNAVSALPPIADIVDTLGRDTFPPLLRA